MSQEPEEAVTEAAAGADTLAPLEQFIEQVLALRDEQRLAAAAARKAVDEAHHERALRAAADLLVRRSEAYADARRRLVGAHLPERLSDEGAPALDGAEAAQWHEVARLVQQAIDDGIVALLLSDVLHPNYLRELYRPWRGVLADEPAPREAGRAGN